MMACRPDGKTDDPADLEAIQVAVDNLGDFKLKTAADFKVVNSQQNTTHLKRLQLISVKEQVRCQLAASNHTTNVTTADEVFCIPTPPSADHHTSAAPFPQLHKHKVAFNDRVLAMRRRKKEVLSGVNAALARAAELQKQLPTALHVPLPVRPELAEDESPEAVYQVGSAAARGWIGWGWSFPGRWRRDWFAGCLWVES